MFLDRSAILRSISENSGIGFLLRSDRSLEEAVMVLADCRSVLVPQWVDEDIDIEFAAPAPGGAVMYIEFATDDSVVGAFLDALIDELSSRGVEGHIEEFLLEWSPVDAPRPMFDCISAGLSLRGEEWYAAVPADQARTGLDVRYRVPDDAFRRVLSHALDWCSVPGGTHFVAAGIAGSRCAAEEREAVVAAGVRNDQLTRITCASDAGAVRRVEFPREGYVIYHERYPELLSANAWAPGVQDLTDVLVQLGDHADYGMLRRQRMPLASWAGFVDYGWPEKAHLAPDAVLDLHSRAASAIPDAFAIMVLSESHRLPHLNSRWVVEDTGARSRLLRRASIDEWFAGPEPDEATVHSAREDLGPLFMTNEMAAEARRVMYRPKLA